MIIFYKLVKCIVRLNPMAFLVASVAEIGWDITAEANGEYVDGMIIGIREYVDSVNSAVKEKKKNES